MQLDSETTFKECFQEYSEMLREGDFYSAFSILARMLRSLPILPDNKKSEWMDRIHGEAISKQSIEAILAGVRRDIYRLNKILSVEGEYNDDECVLILTLRNQIEAIRFFLQERGAYYLDVDLAEIDQKINLIATSEENKHIFKMAI
ncbi:MAG: hypothetical protein J2P31_12070, partial [Blastocatellia bacterium]|nr:hypothetical protein [Blastocatellia bacterium]